MGTATTAPGIPKSRVPQVTAVKMTRGCSLTARADGAAVDDSADSGAIFFGLAFAAQLEAVQCSIENGALPDPED